MIPETKKDSVRRAVQRAFRTNEFEYVCPLPGGLSRAQVHRIAVLGNPYVLKLIPDATGDCRPQLACIAAASELCIAPHVWDAHPVDRILITDFVEAKAFPNDIFNR